MIALHDAAKSFGRIEALRGVTLEAGPGSVTALLGPNGAGKTTAIRVLVGSLIPDRGAATLAGIPVLADRLAAQRALGYLPELASPYPELTPRSYLHLRGRLQGLRRSVRNAAIERETERVGLRGVTDQRIGTLSKGYKKRVGLAAALLHEPPVLVLDEPTDGLDPAQVIETRALIAELARDRTVLLCTHVLSEVERTAGRAAVLVKGRVLADAPPAELAAATGRPGVVLAETRPDPTKPNAGELLLTSLSLLPAVASVSSAPNEADPTWIRLNITTSEGVRQTDLQEAAARTITGLGLPIRELRPITPSLEEVFKELLDRAESDRAEPDRDERIAADRTGPAAA